MSHDALHAGLGVEKDDPRDHVYAPSDVTPPARVDLVTWSWPVWNQMGLNSCTAHVAAAAFQFMEVKEQLHGPWVPSRLFLYYNERVIYDEIEDPTAHAIDHSAPVYMRDGIKALARWGACREDQWTDDPADLYTKFVAPPPQDAYDFASHHTAVRYFKIDVKGKPAAEKMRQFQACLAEGFPFSIGIRLYGDLLSAPGGRIPTPTPDGGSHKGHALLVTGYDDAASRFTVRNSLGAGWGADGNGTIGYDYVCNDVLAEGFWTIRRTT